MRMRKQACRFLALAGALAVLIPAASGFRRSGGVQQGTVSGKVTIYRDDWGVPHIYADKEEDGFFGLGYAQGEDQLNLVLRMFLLVRGEVAAAFGSGQVKTDVESRRWMHIEDAKAGLKRLSPQLLKNYQSYLAGLQRYMDDHPKEVPPWAPKLELTDVVAISRAVVWPYMIREGLAAAQKGGVKLSASLAPALGNKEAWASNEWILAPWRTAQNAMIVLSDPHGGVDGSWVYEFRMEAGPLKVAGYGYGALFILTHNRHVSWGMTTGNPVVSDCYEVDLDPANPRRYQFDGKWEEMVVREVTIAVKDSKPLTQTLEYTKHNGVLSPVIARQDGKAYVVSSAYMHQAGLFDEEIYRMNLARNVKDVREAMKLLGMFPQNVMVGDSEGHSFFVRAGRTPKRPSGYDWTRPLPGNTSKTAWLGIHPLEDLVQVETPPQGYMQNCNIAPDMMMEDCPVKADRYPAYVFNDKAGRTNTRGLRAVEVLSGAFHFTEKDAISLSLDEKLVGTEAWQRALKKALNENSELVRNKPDEFRRFVDAILRFDGNARAESVAALDYFYWRSSLWTLPGLSDKEKDAIGDPLWEKGDLAPELGRILLKGIDQAIEAMTKDHGSIDLRFGDVFRLGRGGISWPLGGGGLVPDNSVASAYSIKAIWTLRAMTFGPPDKLRQRYPWVGSRMLRLVIFTVPLRSYTLHLFGQSEHENSPHYADQARLSSERRLKPTYFWKEDLLNHLVSLTTLERKITSPAPDKKH